MPTMCVVIRCQNVGSHSFPSDETMKAKWIKAIKIFKPGARKKSFICTDHFRLTDFTGTLAYRQNFKHARKILKKTAIPSVFPWNKDTDIIISSLDLVKFDPNKVQTTYSRVPQIAFAEELPFLETLTNDDMTEDPLKTADES